MKIIHINNQEYKYKIGKYFIHIFNSNGAKTITNQSIISGLSPDELEKGYWKKWFTGITPQMVKDFIIKNNI